MKILIILNLSELKTKMNNSHNPSYWFVFREDQSNVIFSSNNFTVQNQQSQEPRYIVETGDRQFIHIKDVPVESAEPSQEVSPVLALSTAQDETVNKGKQDDNFWNTSQIKLLLTLCLENNFKNAPKDKVLLDSIAAHIGTTSDECCTKYKNLRRTFIRLLKKRRQGKPIKWVHYDICEKVFSEFKSLPSSVLEPWDSQRIQILLQLYLENLDRFRSSNCQQKYIWKDIASQIGTTEYNCYHKFKNLKRAYFNRLQRSHDTAKPVKWQYQQYFEKIFHNHIPLTTQWNRNKTRQLMDAYLQMSDKFENTRFLKKDLWKEISTIVGESAHSCDKKFRNLKQTYMKLKIKRHSSNTATKWRYYKDFEAIYNPSQYCNNSVIKSKSEDYVKQLLSFYVENREKFKDPRIKKKHVWRIIGSKIGLSSEGCDRKFRNLKQTYLRLVEKQSNTGKTSNWPYYSYFDKIFGGSTTNCNGCYNKNSNNVTINQIKRVMQQVQANKDCDQFERLISVIEESNNIQRERNEILLRLLDRK